MTASSWLSKPIPTVANFVILTILLAFDLLMGFSPILVGIQKIGIPIGIASSTDAGVASLIGLAIASIPMKRLFRAWRYDLYEMLGMLDRLAAVS